MSDKAQTRLLSVLVLLIFTVLKRPLNNLIDEAVPERRGAADDVTEAVLQGMARVVAVIIASGLVRGFAARRR